MKIEQRNHDQNLSRKIDISNRFHLKYRNRKFNFPRFEKIRNPTNFWNLQK